MSGRDGPRLWGSGRWSVGDQKNRLQPAHGCSIGLFGEGKSEIPVNDTPLAIDSPLASAGPPSGVSNSPPEP